MSTRGIYKIEGIQIYVHSDNYPAGAAVRLAEILRRNSGQISAFEFARANERAELMPGKIPGDVEYIYEVKEGQIFCYRWESVNQESNYNHQVLHSRGEIHEWINENIKPCLEESDNINDWTFVKRTYEYGDKISRFFSVSYIKSEIVRNFNQGLSFFSSNHIGNSSSSFSEAGRLSALIPNDIEVKAYREQYLKVWAPIFAQRYNHKNTEIFDKYWAF